MSWCDKTMRTPWCRDLDCPDCKPHRPKEIVKEAMETVLLSMQSGQMQMEFLCNKATDVLKTPLVQRDPDMSDECDIIGFMARFQWDGHSMQDGKRVFELSRIEPQMYRSPKAFSEQSQLRKSRVPVQRMTELPEPIVIHALSPE